MYYRASINRSNMKVAVWRELVRCELGDTTMNRMAMAQAGSLVPLRSIGAQDRGG